MTTSDSTNQTYEDRTSLSKLCDEWSCDYEVYKRATYVSSRAIESTTTLLTLYQVCNTYLDNPLLRSYDR